MNNTTFKSLNKTSEHVIGGGFLTTLRCSYSHLVNIFGKPTLPTDEYKTSAEWHIEVRRNGKSLGVLAIYDYKQHDNYTKDGTETHEISEWHVGGKDAWLAADLVEFVRHPHLIKHSQNV